jgi:hypothetical protein
MSVMKKLLFGTAITMIVVSKALGGDSPFRRPQLQGVRKLESAWFF